MKTQRTIDPRLIAANTRFGFKLFAQLRQQDSSQNVFISSSSVAIALAMTYNGAAGQTQQIMANALELKGLSLSTVNQSNAALKAALEQADPDVAIVLANALWTKQGVSFKPEFLERNQTFYHAQVAALDFANPSTVGIVNNWVHQQTRGKIPTIIDEITPEQMLLLINATYFKGKWRQPFDPAQTVKRCFYLADGAQKQHPMMSQQGKYRYYENAQFQAVSLPYGQGRLTLDVFLPKSSKSLGTFYQTLTAERWQAWLQQFRPRQGSIQMPRFKIEYAVPLKRVLTILGMGHAFSESANFEAMSSEQLVIDQVHHKIFIEVNEEGTEAAAATSVGVMAASMLPPQRPFRMVVDHPFFCAIRDSQTGTILFMGSIVNPIDSTTMR